MFDAAIVQNEIDAKKKLRAFVGKKSAFSNSK